MRYLQILKVAARALRRNKMRSTLTALGIIIGVGAVIAMVSIGNGARAQVEAQIASLGQNVILIFSGNISRGGVNTGWGNSPSLTIDDATAIGREIPEVVAVSPEVRANRQISARDQNWFTQILGESPDYIDIRQWPLSEGNMFSDTDIRNGSKVAVIGQTIVNQLFPNDDPVGQSLRIRNVPFTVVGVLSPKGPSAMGSDQDDVILVPYTTAIRHLNRNGLRSFMVQVYSPDALTVAQQKIADLLRQRHRIGPGKDDDFMIRNQEEIAQAATQTSRVMTLLLGAIASVSMIVGGIGIMNIMLVSVTERTREIGTRMAVGAHARHILLQFLIESVLLSSIGGVIGIAMGVGASKLVSAVWGWPTLVSPAAIVLSFVFSASVGVFFGFYPAKKAAELDPIDALRFE